MDPAGAGEPGRPDGSPHAPSGGPGARLAGSVAGQGAPAGQDGPSTLPELIPLLPEEPDRSGGDRGEEESDDDLINLEDEDPAGSAPVPEQPPANQITLIAPPPPEAQSVPAAAVHVGLQPLPPIRSPAPPVLPSEPANEEGLLSIKLYTYPQSKTYHVQVRPDDLLSTLAEVAAADIPEGSKVKILYNARTLDAGKTFEQERVPNQSTLHLFASRAEAPRPHAEAPRFVGVYRGGLEVHLQAGVERSDVVAMRLAFLARAGYISSEQLQILYMNEGILEHPRGYTQPGIPQVRAFLIHCLQPDASESGGRQLGSDPSQKAAPRAQRGGQPSAQVSNLPVAQFYREQPAPVAGEDYPNEFVSNVSFALMMLEGGFPAFLQRHFADLADLSFISDETPLPVIPVRAIRCEELWVDNNSPDATIYSIASANNLLGPGTPIQPPRNQVTSSFSRFMNLIAGVVIGLLFNVLAVVYTYHSGLRYEIKLGILYALIGNLIFSLFMGLAGVL